MNIKNIKALLFSLLSVLFLNCLNWQPAVSNDNEELTEEWSKVLQNQEEIKNLARSFIDENYTETSPKFFSAADEIRIIALLDGLVKQDNNLTNLIRVSDLQIRDLQGKINSLSSRLSSLERQVASIRRKRGVNK